jgi:hypothetical protein
LRLGLAQRDVTLGTINRELNQRGSNAKDITKEMDNMVSEADPLWLINELHNHSKHRNLIGQAINIINGRLDRASLINPRTGEGMRTADGRRFFAIDYLEQSYTRIEELQRTVRNKISHYRNLTGA